MNNSKKHIQSIQNHQKEKNIKKSNLRRSSVDEVIFIFEKVLEDWKPIKIYNVCIQNNPLSKIIKEDIENTITGNCKVFDFETTPEKFQLYNDLREKVYDYHKNKNKKNYKNVTFYKQIILKIFHIILMKINMLLIL